MAGFAELAGLGAQDQELVALCAVCGVAGLAGHDGAVVGVCAAVGVGDFGGELEGEPGEGVAAVLGAVGAIDVALLAEAAFFGGADATGADSSTRTVMRSDMTGGE